MNLLSQSQLPTIEGKNAELIGEEDWKAIQETLYLNSIPDMSQSILASKEKDLSECTSYDPNEEW